MWGDHGGFNQGGGFEGSGGFNSPGGFGTPQNVEEKRVTLIGLIRSVKESATRVDYEIDDMTGPPLDVKQFVDNDENVPEDERVPSMRENTYVRVCGHVRSFQGKKNVVAFNIRPLDDMNQITCHILSVVHAHAVTNMTGQTSNQSTSAAVAAVDNGGGGSTNFGMSALHNQIANIIKNNTTEMGASIADVAKHMKNVSEKAIREAVEFLSSEGHIYSTIDDDHFKATDS